jgi:D-glycero-alpha-D-manno-heptose-7-phosphate kinase
MIISRTPLRMSFVGGGSDLPAFYRRRIGAVVSTAIDKYIYVNINKKFDGGIRLAYSKTEEVDSVGAIEHRLVRATFESLSLQGGVEITTIADIPSRGTGLGSSSTFTVGLINAVSAYQGRHISADNLGRLACEIEIERCGEPIGKQDQYAAAFGGFNLIEFKPDESVLVSPIIMPHSIRETLERRIVVFYTGITRNASEILKQQSAAMASDEMKQTALVRMVELTYQLRDELQAGNLDSFGEILHENWRLKKSLAAGVSSGEIDDWYAAGCAAGARGGKILGAGAGGFLMFYAPEETHAAIERALPLLRRVEFRFDLLGSRIIFYNPTNL